MQIRSVDGNRQDMDLQFLKPFKSQAEVALVLNPVSQDTTDITWTMDTSLPFFLFFMTGMMKSMIGMDFERGLKMLKAYCEEGEVNSSIEIVGVVDAPESRFIGFDTTSALNDIGDSMDETLPLISEQASALGLTASASGDFYTGQRLSYVANNRYAFIDGRCR